MHRGADERAIGRLEMGQMGNATTRGTSVAGQAGGQTKAIILELLRLLARHSDARKYCPGTCWRSRLLGQARS